MRTCTACGLSKPLDSFSVEPSGTPCSRCKACKVETTRRYQKTERGRASMRRAHLFWAYKITVEDYDQMLANQGGRCALCGSTDPKPNKVFCVDHDHACCPGAQTCGKCIRGLLCPWCNNRMGWFDTHSKKIKAYIS